MEKTTLILTGAVVLCHVEQTPLSLPTAVNHKSRPSYYLLLVVCHMEKTTLNLSSAIVLCHVEQTPLHLTSVVLKYELSVNNLKKSHACDVS